MEDEFRKMLESFHVETFEMGKLPKFREHIVVKLVEAVQELFSQESMCLSLSGEYVVIGDLHGHVFDLLRILQVYGLPPARRYLFLGDYVDRGNFSTETITLIYLLKVLFPNHIYLIRGNHEFEIVNKEFGFYSEVMTMYKSPLIYMMYNLSFGYMPIAAVVNDSVYCVHGGIGPKITEISQFSAMKKPLKELGDTDEVFWSDPSDKSGGFVVSDRGRGYKFGATEVSQFLDKNGLKMLVRGHQVVEDGVTFSMGNRVATIFSASDYIPGLKNKSGVLVLTETGHEVMAFEGLYVKREAVSWDEEKPAKAKPHSGFNGRSLNIPLKKLAPARICPVVGKRMSMVVAAKTPPALNRLKNVNFG